MLRPHVLRACAAPWPRRAHGPPCPRPVRSRPERRSGPASSPGRGGSRPRRPACRSHLRPARVIPAARRAPASALGLTAGTGDHVPVVGVGSGSSMVGTSRSSSTVLVAIRDCGRDQARGHGPTDRDRKGRGRRRHTRLCLAQVAAGAARRDKRVRVEHDYGELKEGLGLGPLRRPIVRRLAPPQSPAATGSPRSQGS
ncbi:hypothetical protein FRACA_550001 [Frankia canadensis]|uniref:Transposase n=1 Tax=Frankia canadensis TaxID=1836972 RepID=A0A2I2KYW4_9ACTN|nr:hypothetical protein FRACA_550001 [Frankia canadensis]SOU58136.1 hypothetical protein FRACA_550001 [Frankia canadensis]